MIENDYLTRQIDIIIKTMAILVPDADMDKRLELHSEDGEKLMELISEGKIGEAENYLFELIENEKSVNHLFLTLLFYKALNSMSAKKLQTLDFSKDEILAAFDELKDIFDIEF